MSAPKETPTKAEQRDMVRELREVRSGLRGMRDALEQSITELQNARLAAQTEGKPCNVLLPQS